MISVNTPLLDGNEKKYLAECIDTGWISSEGPFVSRLEQEMAVRLRRSHGVAVCNGSVALDLAIAALEIGPGDEVILPTLTIISCAAAVVRAGATPVVVDCDPITWNMNVCDLEARITSKTKAIMVVHVYGLPVDMAPVLELAQRYGLRVVEDAAELIGQEYNQLPCGSFGDISTLSFYSNKHVTTGEGGMVLTNDASLAEKCRSLRNLCFQKKRFVHEELGWNFRMSNIQAAIGVAQLERLDEFIDRKRMLGQRYNTLLQDAPNLQLPLHCTGYACNIYWVYGVVLGDSVQCDAEQVINSLAQSGIGCRPFFWPLHEQPVFRRMGLFAGERYPNAERAARRGFYLPSGLGTTIFEQEQSAAALKNLLENSK